MTTKLQPQLGTDPDNTDAPLHNYVGMGYKWESSRRWGNASINVSSFSQDAVLASTAVGGKPSVDHTAAVDSFFASIRVPASFLVAASFNELFMAVGDNEAGIQKFLQILYLASMGFSFVLSMNVLILSTSALIRSLAENFDSYAETGYELLFREFHFEFVCVRWSFMTSLFGFLLAVTARILLEFELFHVTSSNHQPYHLELGIAVCLIMTSLLLHLSSYVNSTLIGWSNIWDMTWDMLKIIARRGSWKQPLEPISLALLILGLLFILLAFIPGSQLGN